MGKVRGFTGVKKLHIGFVVIPAGNKTHWNLGADYRIILEWVLNK
jgi:hypothetical protein